MNCEFYHSSSTVKILINLEVLVDVTFPQVYGDIPSNLYSFIEVITIKSKLFVSYQIHENLSHFYLCNKFSSLFLRVYNILKISCVQRLFPCHNIYSSCQNFKLCAYCNLLWYYYCHHVYICVNFIFVFPVEILSILAKISKPSGGGV